MASQHQSQLLNNGRLPPAYTISVLYHDIFEYPLSVNDLSKWVSGKKLTLRVGRPKIACSDNYYFLSGKEHLIFQRNKNQLNSTEKLKIVNRVKPYFEKDKNILMVGITGSLAMANAREDSDIDLMVVTKKGKVWTTRLFYLLYLPFKNISLRKAGNKIEKDKLCLNIWMDESDLEIDIENRNAYTAHEIAQVVPVINKENTYQRLLKVNEWLLDYWPKSVEISHFEFLISKRKYNPFSSLIENIAYILQKAYMARKKTREVVSPTRAFFHPFSWSKKVKAELNKRGVYEL